MRCTLYNKQKKIRWNDKISDTSSRWHVKWLYIDVAVLVRYFCCALLWLVLWVPQLPWTQLFHNFWSASVPKLHVSLPSQCWLQHKLDSSNTCSNRELSPVSGGWSSNAPISVRIVTLWSRIWWEWKPIFQFKKNKGGLGGRRRENPPASTCHPLLLTEGEGRLLIFCTPQIRSCPRLGNKSLQRHDRNVPFYPLTSTPLSRTRRESQSVAPANQSRIGKHVLSWIKHPCSATKNCAVC